MGVWGKGSSFRSGSALGPVFYFNSLLGLSGRPFGFSLASRLRVRVLPGVANESKPRRGEITEGVFRARCVDATLGRTSREKYKVVLTFEVIGSTREDDYDDRQYPEAIGSFVTYIGWITPRALTFAIGALRACGWVGFDLYNLDSCLYNQGGRDVEIEIKEDDYEHAKQPFKVDRVKPIVDRDAWKANLPATNQVSVKEGEILTNALRATLELYAVLDPDLASPRQSHDEIPF